jgi:hypothetical protein
MSAKTSKMHRNRSYKKLSGSRWMNKNRKKRQISSVRKMRRPVRNLG